MSAQPPANSSDSSKAVVQPGSLPTTELLPSPQTLLQAARLAIKDDRPIQLDYYVDSANSRAFVGEDGETKEKVLMKSKEEFTSNVTKLYKSGDDFLILTENSLYIVHSKIQKRRINLNALQADTD
jgi:hypothetical protein